SFLSYTTLFRASTVTVLLVKNIHVALVAIGMDEPLFQFLKNHTARLVDVRTIIVLALTEILPHLWKIMRKLVVLHIQDSEFLDSRSVDQVASFGQSEKFCKGRSVHPFCAVPGNLLGFLPSLWDQRIQQRGLAHARMAGNQTGFPLDERQKLFGQPLLSQSRHLQHRVS